MTIALSAVLEGMRDSHPAFDEERVGDGLVARWMTQYQRRLFQKALKFNKQMCASSFMISLVPSDDNTAPYSGAGQVGELPAASASGTGTVDPLELPSGYAASVTEGATALAETVVSSATATTLTRVAAAWTVNAYQDKMLKIVRGTGAGQQRIIIANSATVLTVDEWATIPDATSVFVIVSVTLNNSTHAVLVDFPLTEDRLAYLVKTDATGATFIDWTVPIVGKLGVGIDLPEHHVLLGGTVFFDDGETDKLTIVGYQARFRAPGDFPAYVSDGKLWLVGLLETWEEIAQIEVRYVPVPPALTAVASQFLLPDTAGSALIARAAYEAARRIEALGMKINIERYDRDFREAEQDFLDELSMQRRGRFTVLRG